MKNKKCLIIYNPISGKKITQEVLDEYKMILTSRGYYVDLIITKYSNHATEVVKQAENYDIIFSIGGDGTLNEVIKGNFSRNQRITICPLPSGTCNDVATMLGYGKNSINNLKIALDGEINNIDIGTINNTPFAYVVGIGKFMNISYETSSEDKRKRGYMAYLKESLTELFDSIKRYKTEIIIDGKKINGNYSLIMISNSNHIAGINEFYKDVCLNDGEMEVLLCKAENIGEFITNFLKFFINQSAEQIMYIKAKEISIKLLEKPEKSWCIDGEKYNYTEEEYNIKINDKMPILTPKTRVKKLFKQSIKN